jgi:hypothetical protein
MTRIAVSRSFLALAASAALLSACGHSGETVFTRQNQAASALATMGMEAEAKNPLRLDKIYAAETQLHDACAPLRDVASRRMSGQDVGLDTQLVAFVSLDRCESETSRIETFIWQDDPTVARLYLTAGGTQEALK